MRINHRLWGPSPDGDVHVDARDASGSVPSAPRIDASAQTRRLSESHVVSDHVTSMHEEEKQARDDSATK